MPMQATEQRQTGDACVMVATCLCPKNCDQVFYVRADKRVLNDRVPICFQRTFEFVDVAVLVCFYQVCHGLYFWVGSIRLGLLCIERVNVALHKHACQHQVLQALDPACILSMSELF